MLHLHLLGGASLAGPTGPLTARATQRRRLALLAVLAAARGAPVSRDKLVALLWPESDTDSARHLLRDSLYVLRSALGEQSLVALADDIRLDPCEVAVDVHAFERALDEGTPARAVAHYAGPFLDGFHVKDAPEFERWVEVERARLAARCQTALEELAEECEARADRLGAVAWWRRRGALEPLNGRVALRLAGALEAAGDRAGALDHLRVHASLLEQELGAAPDPAAVALAVRLRTPTPTGVQSPTALSPSVVAPAAPDGPEASTPRPLGDGVASSVSATDVAAGRSDAPRRGWWRFPRVALAAVVSGALLVAIDPAPWWRHDAALDASTVAILPFRAAGADPSLGFLREGMVDLLTAKLGAGPGLHAVDPRAVLREWRRAGGSDTVDLAEDGAAAVAARTRAGRILLGAVAGTPAHLALSARLIDAGTGRPRAQGMVEGPADSLPVLVDRLAGALLALDAGEGERRLASLTSTSLPAVRAYLAGQALARRGAMVAAGDQFARALELDSNFALAAFGLRRARLASVTVREQLLRAERLAWRGRERLDARDRLRLIVELGRRYPAAPTVAERIAAGEELVTLAPADGDAWDTLGSLYYYYGATVGVPDWMERARRAYERAFSVDSTNAEYYARLPEIYTQQGDTAALRRAVATFARLVGSSSSNGPDGWTATVRYIGLRRLGDSAAARALRRRMLDSLPAALEAMRAAANWGLIDVADGDSAVRRTVASATTDWERINAIGNAYEWQLQRGRPRRAAALFATRWDSTVSAEADVDNAVFWDGDAALAARGARVLARLLAEPVPAIGAPPGLLARRLTQTVALAEYRLAQHDTSGARRLLESLRPLTAHADSARLRELRDAMELMLDAQLTTLARRPDARTLVTRLDSVLRLGPRESANNWWYTPFYAMANLVAARLWEAHGDLPRALAATRRRRVRLSPAAYFSTYLREEGRLAARAGDRAGAVRAYRHYVALRADPEPALRPDAERVRAELDRLDARARR